MPATPGGGTIVFYDPQPKRTSPSKKALSPSTITITTEGGKGQRPDEPAHTAAGTIPREGRENRASLHRGSVGRSAHGSFVSYDN